VGVETGVKKVYLFDMFDVNTTVSITLMTMLRIMGMIPRKWAFGLGNILGMVIFLIDKKHRNIAIDNLICAFGHEKDPYEIKKLAREVFKNLGQIIFEIGWSLKLDRSDFSKYFCIEGLPNYRTVFEKGKGVLLLTAHAGNWELMSIIAEMTAIPVSVLFRPLDFAPLNQLLIRFRSRFGAKLIPTAGSMRKILKALKSGESMGMLMDQNVDWYEGVFVDFFNKRACTNKGLALLALKTEAPVVPVFLIRNKAGFKAIFGDEIPLIQTGDKTKDIEANTQMYNRVIESIVRRYPEQWLWVHQRWKTRPYQPWPRE